MRNPLCTCQWSPVYVNSVDPPHITRRNPDCWVHSCARCQGPLEDYDEDLCDACEMEVDDEVKWIQSQRED